MPYRVGPEINVFELAGVDLLSDLQSFTLKVDNTELDTSVLTQYAGRAQAGASQLTLDCTVFSQTSPCSQKVTGLNLTAFSWGGTSYATTFKSLNFTLDATTDDVSAAADVWMSTQTVGFTLSSDFEIMVPTGTSHALFANLNTSAATKNNIVLTFTISGTTITFPCSIMSVEYGNQGKVVTTIKVSAKGHPACTGDFPTAPTSSSSLLTGFLVDPMTAVNFEFSSNATSGEIVDVNMSLRSLSFSIERNAIVSTSYSLMSVGAPSNTIA